MGVPERGSPLVRLFAQKLVEGLAIDVERLYDLRTLKLHVLQRLGGQVHDRAEVTVGAQDFRDTFVLQEPNGSSGDTLQLNLVLNLHVTHKRQPKIRALSIWCKFDKNSRPTTRR